MSTTYVITWRDPAPRGIYQRPDETLERIHAVLTRAGAPGLRRRLLDDWRPHFPVKR